MINIVVGMSSQASGSGSTSSNAQPSALSSQSFESELSEAISDALTKLGVDPGSVQLTVRDSDGNNIGTSQKSVAAATPAPSANVASPAAATTAPAASGSSFDDQYWSKQPAAVQQLRNIPDQNERTQLGEQLAGEGYSIDVPVMVWGWDPSVTTQLRQSYGYTWVPSGLQPPIESAPGITVPGLTPYDPNDPPAGSIAV